ncbi:MAG TPA: DUF4382 domain-containing protein [Balneolales bacterium]|nr:DUF4382 domain-containing protein [Balneolales bacterium]
MSKAITLQNKIIRLFITILIAFGLFSLQACSNHSNDNGQAHVQVHMTDSPANFDALIVNITRIEAHTSGAGANNGWHVISDTPVKVNIMNLTNGQTKLLANNQLKSDNYDAIRLVLGTGNKVVIGGQTHALKVPSGMQSGIKINTNMNLSGGQNTNILLEFNASASVVLTGNLTYILKPVIHVVNYKEEGNIDGTINPVKADAALIASNSQDTTATYADTTSGKFKLVGLQAGTYNVHVYSNSKAYNDTTLTNIKVNANANTKLGTVTLSSKDTTKTATMARY